MATTQTTVTGEAVPWPYRTLPSPAQKDSNLPLGEFRFGSTSSTIEAADAGEDQRFIVNCELPKNYSYALLSVNAAMQFAAADIPDWQLTAHATWANSITGAGRVSVPFAGIGARMLVDNFVIWDFNNNIPSIIHEAPPNNSGQVRLSFRGTNAVIDGGECYLTWQVRVLYYQIAQGHSTLINTPILTR